MDRIASINAGTTSTNNKYWMTNTIAASNDKKYLFLFTMNFDFNARIPTNANNVHERRDEPRLNLFGWCTGKEVCSTGKEVCSRSSSGNASSSR